MRITGRRDRGVVDRRARGHAVRPDRTRRACRRSRSVPAADVVRTSEGLHTGAQIDRIVLASAPGGGPLAVERRPGHRVSAPRRRRYPRSRWCTTARPRMRVHVNGAHVAVLARAGRVAEQRLEGDHRADRRARYLQLVDGYANGWLVKPTSSSFDVVLQWTPQQQVWAAIWISAARRVVVHRDRRLRIGAAPAATGSGTPARSMPRSASSGPSRPRGTPRESVDARIACPPGARRHRGVAGRRAVGRRAGRDRRGDDAVATTAARPRGRRARRCCSRW